MSKMSKKKKEGLDDLLKFLKSTHKFLKKHRVISKGSLILDEFGTPYANQAHKNAVQLGYGYGGDLDGTGLKHLMKFAKKSHKYLKKHKIISKASDILAAADVPAASQIAHAAKTLGYGGKGKGGKGKGKGKRGKGKRGKGKREGKGKGKRKVVRRRKSVKKYVIKGAGPYNNPNSSNVGYIRT